MKRSEIPDGHWWTVAAPSPYFAVASGCLQAGQERDGSITLQYTDKTTEKAEWPDGDAPEIDDLADNWFTLVRTVQDRARREP